MRLASRLFGLLATVAVSGPATAQSPYFANYYSFGDSLSDTGRVLRETGFDGPAVIAGIFGGPGIYQPHAGIFSNSPNFLQILPGEVGLPYVASNNYGIGYATSGDQPPFALTSPTYPLGFKNQIDQFLARGGSFGARDLVNVWFGFNDISTIPANATAAQVTAGIATIYGNIGAGIARLQAVGGRNFVVFDTQTYRSGTVSPVSEQFNRDFVAQVLQPVADTGANVHFFDVAALSDRMRANPTAYGFAADAGTVSCLQDPVCKVNGATTGLENQYISPEGIHFTGRANQIIAAYVANQLNAPLSIGPQADLASAAGTSFSGTIVDLLGNERNRALALTDGTSEDAAPPRSAVPLSADGRLSLFLLGDFVNVDRDSRSIPDGGTTGTAVGADFGGATVGLLYHATPGVTVGGAFNYLTSRTTLDGLGGGRIRLRTYQGAVFGSASFDQIFVDAVASYGGGDFALQRPGVMGDNLTASPSDRTATVATRVGYVFDHRGVGFGPVGELSYAHTAVDPYREDGDTLLSIGVKRQHLQRLTLGAGVQIRATKPIIDGLVQPYINVTAQRGLLDRDRTVQSYQTYAPTLVIRTDTGDSGYDWHGRLAGGANIGLGHRVTATITGSTTFAERGGEDRVASAGLRLGF